MKIRYMVVVLLALSLFLFGCTPDVENKDEKDGKGEASVFSSAQQEAATSSGEGASSGIFEVYEGVGTLPSIPFDSFK